MIIASGPGCADFCDGRCNEPNNRNQYSTGAQHHNDYVYDEYDHSDYDDYDDYDDSDCDDDDDTNQ